FRRVLFRSRPRSAAARRYRDGPGAWRRSAPARPRRRRRCPSCRPRRARRARRRGPPARTDRWTRPRAGPAAPRRCGRAAPAPARRRRARALPTGCRPRRSAGIRRRSRRGAGVRPPAPGSRRRPASPTAAASVPSPAPAPRWSLAEPLLEAVVAEALADHAVRGHHHRAPHQRRVFAQQQLPLGVGLRRLAHRRQVAPGRRGLVDHGVPAAELRLPFDQRFRRRPVVAVVDEFVVDAEAVEPLARLSAGVAVGQAVESCRHPASPRSRSLTEVLARVRASTRLTITAQYSECEPSAAGSCPDTTTLYGGMRP